jgi:O-antigen ligase
MNSVTKLLVTSLWFSVLVIINPLVSVENPFRCFYLDGMGAIWTYPKIVVIGLIAVYQIVLIFLYKKSHNSMPVDKLISIFMALFLLSISISAIYSQFPSRAFWGGHVNMMGWVTMALLFLVVLSSIQFLRVQPTLAIWQWRGILAGAIANAILILMQQYDSGIDATFTSRMFNPLSPHPKLVSGLDIHSSMPSGFYINRGYVGMVLGFVFMVQYQIYLHKKNIWTAVGCILLIFAIIATPVRAIYLSLFLSVALIYLYHKKIKLHRIGKDIIHLMLVIAIGIAVNTGLKSINADNYVVKKKYSSLSSMDVRIMEWKFSVKAIVQKPWFGWGADGFGIAFPFINEQARLDSGSVQSMYTIVDVVDNGYIAFTGEKELGVQNQHVKSHNLILESLVSWGFIGSFILLVLWGIWLKLVWDDRNLSLLFVAIFIMLYCMLWFTVAGNAILLWWLFALGIAGIDPIALLSNKQSLGHKE